MTNRVDLRFENLRTTESVLFVLGTVPTIVIAHAFCISPDTRMSYLQCLLIQGSFARFKKVDLSKY